MAAQDLTIHARGGTTDRPTVDFVAGRVVEAFSVGTRASWSIQAAGVQPTHAYLYFDGAQLFAASAPGATVKLNGAHVGADWVPVPAGGEMQLGALALVVRAAAAPQPRQSSAGPQPRQSSAGPQPRQSSAGPQPRQAPTRSSPAASPRPGPARPAAPRGPAPAPVQRPQAGASAYDADAAPTRVQALPPEFLDEDPSEQTTVMPGTRVPDQVVQSAPRPAAGAPPERRQERPERPAPPSSPPASGEATVVQPLEDFLAQRGAPTGDAEGGAPQQAQQAQQPQQLPHLPGPPAGPPGGARGVYIQPPEPTMPPGGEHAWAMMQRPQQFAQGGAGQQAPPQAWAPGTQQSGVPGADAGQLGQPGQPGQPLPPGQQPYPPGAIPPLVGTPSQFSVAALKQWWRLAPLPRKIMVFVAPFAMVSFYLIFFNDPAPRTRRLRPSPSASSAPATSVSAPLPVAGPDANTEDAAAPNVAADAAAPNLAAAPPVVDDSGAPDPRLREAVDAVASGDHRKAAAIYRELAKQYPNQPAYGWAAEILERRAQQAP